MPNPSSSHLDRRKPVDRLAPWRNGQVQQWRVPDEAHGTTCDRRNPRGCRRPLVGGKVSSRWPYRPNVSTAVAHVTGAHEVGAAVEVATPHKVAATQ